MQLMLKQNLNYPFERLALQDAKARQYARRYAEDGTSMQRERKPIHGMHFTSFMQKNEMYQNINTVNVTLESIKK